MRSLLYIITILVITGCSVSNSKTEILDEAQRIMPSDPHTALSKLNELDLSEFSDSATMARWALLYTEAMVANRLTIPTDTIVNIAVDYYGRHNLLDEYRKATRLKALAQNESRTDALATALYLQKEREFFLYKERATRNIILFSGFIIILVAIGIIMFMCQRLKIESLRNDALIAEASGLKCRIDDNNNNIDRLQSNLHGLLDDRFALIDSLCQTYYESRDTKSERKAIIEKVKNEIESVRTDSFPKLEQTVNVCRDNILDRIRESYPNIKPDDYRLLVYLISGFSIRTICLLLDVSPDIIYKRKSRLKSRMKKYTITTFSDISSIF